jgi:hypothetical protein
MNQAPGEAAVLLGASSLSILKLNKGQIHKYIRGWGQIFFDNGFKDSNTSYYSRCKNDVKLVKD